MIKVEAVISPVVVRKATQKGLLLNSEEFSRLIERQ